MKMSEKQYELLKKLYKQRKGQVTPNVEIWLENLPPIEASALIDKWIKKSQKYWHKNP